jgi:plastocyanin
MSLAVIVTARFPQDENCSDPNLSTRGNAPSPRVLLPDFFRKAQLPEKPYRMKTHEAKDTLHAPSCVIIPRHSCPNLDAAPFRPLCSFTLPIIALLALLAPWAKLKAETVHVTVTFAQGFSPQNVEIIPGDTIEWDWVSGQHSTTSDTGVWDSGIHNTGNPVKFTYSHAFATEGTFPYHCSVHTSETGTITVRSKWPVGYYSLTDGNSANPKVIDPTDPVLLGDIADGFRLRLSWSDIQPDTVNGATYDSTNFNWTLVDSAVATARAHGKKLGISISAGRYCPNWIFTVGAHQFVLDESDNSLTAAGPGEPIPWDPVFQQYWFAFIDAFGARVGDLGVSYDHDPAIQYVISTGHQQFNENRFVTTADESITFPTDVSGVTGTTSNPSGIGAHGKLYAPGANFLRTDYSGTGNANILGKTISDASHAIFGGSTAVCGLADGCPADPTTDTVYLSKRVLTTGSGQTFTVEAWNIGHGDTYKMNNIAKDPVGTIGRSDYTVYNDISPCNNISICPSNYDPNAHTPFLTAGYAVNRGYEDGAEAVMDEWVQAFPHTPVILTGAKPLADPYNPWTTYTESNVKNHLQANPLGGFMTASLFAICQADYCGGAGNQSCLPIVQTTPKGDQAIYPLTNSGVYQSTCSGGFPAYSQRVYDLCEGALEHGDTYLEPYYPDINTGDTAGQTAWRTERLLFDDNKP